MYTSVCVSLDWYWGGGFFTQRRVRLKKKKKKRKMITERKDFVCFSVIRARVDKQVVMGWSGARVLRGRNRWRVVMDDFYCAHKLSFSDHYNVHCLHQIKVSLGLCQTNANNTIRTVVASESACIILDQVPCHRSGLVIRALTLFFFIFGTL